MRVRAPQQEASILIEQEQVEDRNLGIVIHTLGETIGRQEQVLSDFAEQIVLSVQERSLRHSLKWGAEGAIVAEASLEELRPLLEVLQSETHTFEEKVRIVREEHKACSEAVISRARSTSQPTCTITNLSDRIGQRVLADHLHILETVQAILEAN